MVSGSTSGSYELRSRAVEKFPLSQLRARRLAEWRKRGKVDKWAALTEEERKELRDPHKAYAEQCLLLATRALKHFNKTSRAKRSGSLSWLWWSVTVPANDPFLSYLMSPIGLHIGDPSPLGRCLFCLCTPDIPPILHPLDGFLNEGDD
ncbi:hypothetical protein Ancab_033143 [Ancistrocladus abbreviatus]